MGQRGHNLVGYGILVPPMHPLLCCHTLRTFILVTDIDRSREYKAATTKGTRLLHSVRIDGIFSHAYEIICRMLIHS